MNILNIYYTCVFDRDLFVANLANVIFTLEGEDAVRVTIKIIGASYVYKTSQLRVYDQEVESAKQFFDYLVDYDPHRSDLDQIKTSLIHIRTTLAEIADNTKPTT